MLKSRAESEGVGQPEQKCLVSVLQMNTERKQKKSLSLKDFF